MSDGFLTDRRAIDADKSLEISVTIVFPNWSGELSVALFGSGTLAYVRVFLIMQSTAANDNRGEFWRNLPGRARWPREHSASYFI
jgi:hypothetical protein